MSQKRKTESSFDPMVVAKDILDKTEEEVQKMDPVNILVVGKTGVGKSTLINNLFREKLATTGVGKPVTDHLNKITKEGIPINLYDTRGYELDPTVQEQVNTEIQKLFATTNGSQDEIHVVYYCINGNSNRLEDLEEDLIRKVSTDRPVILVLTQSIGEPAQAFRDYLLQADLPVEDVINVMAEAYVISDDLVIPQYGLKTLANRTFDVIPDDADRAFNNAQVADISRKAEAAKEWAKKYILASFGVGFAPIPFSDATVLIPMQVTLIAHISAIFGISLDKSAVLSLVSAVLGTGGATYVGRYISGNLLKLIPGAGTLASGLINGTTAAGLTSALAMAYIEVLTRITLAEREGRTSQLPDIGAMMKEAFSDRIKSQEEVDDMEDVDEAMDEDMTSLKEDIEAYEGSQQKEGNGEKNEQAGR